MKILPVLEDTIHWMREGNVKFPSDDAFNVELPRSLYEKFGMELNELLIKQSFMVDEKVSTFSGQSQTITYRHPVLGELRVKMSQDNNLYIKRVKDPEVILNQQYENNHD